MIVRNSRAIVVLVLSSLSWQVFANDFNYSGYIDTSYNYLVKNHEFISGNNDRVYDLAQNGLTLQQAAVTLSLQPKEGLGGLLNVFVGRDAYSLAPYGWNPYYGSQTLGLVVPGAYVQYAMGNWLLLGGLFDTLMGAESFVATRDFNFSRSILDGYAEPGILMGVRSVYRVGEAWEFALGLNNGWSGIRDTGRQKTIECGATLHLNHAVSLMLQGLSGEQRLLNNIATGPTGLRQLINFVAKFDVMDKVSLAATADYGLQTKAMLFDGTIGRAVWRGLGAYINYQFIEKWRVACRGEIYNDRDGYTTKLRQNWRELTMTLGYVPMQHIELRAETRHDVSNINAFLNASGPGASRHQQSYAVEALYHF